MEIVKANNKNWQIDPDSNRIDFLDTRFYMDPEGKYFPSVTTILEAYPKGPQYYEWLKRVGEDADSIRDEAGTKGSTVHHLTERYDNGEEVTLIDPSGNISYKMIEWAMFERYVEFRSRFEMEILHTELNLVDSELGYAGTLDRVVSWNGKKLLIDIKTGNAIYNHFWLQLAAYEQLFLRSTAEEVGGVAILWLNAKTKTDGTKGAIQGKGWQLLVRDEADKPAHLNRFMATHELWLAENENALPKLFSYQLKHQI